jgi:hypothetical protein
MGISRKSNLTNEAIMTDETTLIAPALEEAEEPNEFELDAALNGLAMKLLTFLNTEVAENKSIPEEYHVDVMFNASKAALFNIMMHIAESAQLDPRELLQQTFDELTGAIESMSGGCCGGGDHHHH